MRLGVADRNRTNVNGITTRGSAIELRPPPSALSLTPRTGFEPATSHHRQAGTLATESTKQIKKVPVTGSGAAQSLRPVCVAARERAHDRFWRRVRDLNRVVGLKARRPIRLDEHDLKTSTSAVPPREPSRRMRRLAARGQVSCRAHPAPRTPCVVRRRSAGAHPKWKEKQKSPDPLRNPGLWNSEYGRRVSQTRLPPGSRQSSDSRRSRTCPIGRPLEHGRKARTNTCKPTRAWALR
jgi:hypothetical protein